MNFNSPSTRVLRWRSHCREGHRDPVEADTNRFLSIWASAGDRRGWV